MWRGFLFGFGLVVGATVGLSVVDGLGLLGPKAKEKCYYNDADGHHFQPQPTGEKGYHTH